MSQQIELWGAIYSNVPAVDLPTSNNTTARFMDTTDADATASDITSGKTAYVNNVKVIGTNSGGAAAGSVYQDSDGYLVLDDDSGGRYDPSDATATAADILSPKTAYISGGKVTGQIATKTSSDLSASGATVSVPAGYYASAASKSVDNGSLGNVTWTNEKTSTTFKITGTYSNFSEGYISSVNPVVRTFTLQEETVTPSMSQQVITPSTANAYLNKVTVEAMQSGTAGTPTATKGEVSNHSVSVTPSVTNQTGYITGGTKTGTAVTVAASELVSGTYTVDSSGTKDVTNYASASVAAGTAGTPTAAKGAVSNHAISVTPSVTNTTGWISGSTKTGTAVTVSASELVSGTKEITANGTGIDVTDYASVDVSVASTPATYTATITHVEGSTYQYPRVQVNGTGTSYYANGATFTYTTSDTLKFYVAGIRAGGTVYVDGVKAQESYDPFYYTYTPPARDIAIEFVTDTDGVVYVYTNFKALQSKTVSYTPSSAAQTDTVTPDSGYGGLSQVTVNVAAAAGGTYQAKTNINPTTSSQTITPDSGYDALSSVQINAMPNGTVSASATKGTVSNHSISVTPKATVGTAGYLPAGDTTGTAVTVSASELVSGSETKTSNGTYDVTNLASLVVNVSGGTVTKDVDFVDYDGTVLYSYTKSEFNALSAMPSNPSHTGLISQGWNWSLSDAKTYLQSSPHLTIGQMYNTDDGKTRLHIEIDEDYLSVKLLFWQQSSGAVTVSWGDGSADSTSTTGGNTTVTHTYSDAGNYTISVSCLSNKTWYLRPSQNTNSFKISTLGDNAILKGANIGSYYLNTQGLAYNTSMEWVTLPNTFGSSSSDYMFYGCMSLKHVTLPTSMTNISGYTFSECRSLETVSFTKTVNLSGNYVFNYCTSLKKLDFPPTFAMATSQLSYCTSMTEFSLKSSTITGTGGGNNLYSLEKADLVGSSVTSLYFSGCYNLKEVKFPTTVTSFNSSAFSQCGALESIEIPSAITTIPQSCFYFCYNLKSVTIPSEVTSIGSGAFNACYSLRTITIPSKVTSIGNNAFYNCLSMHEYHVLPTTPPTLGTNVFYGITAGTIIYVPAESLTTYQTAENWSVYASYMVGE